MAAAGLVLAAGGALRGADAPPSLDEVKGDLKAIKRSDSTELNNLGASAREALPKFTPAPDSPPPPPAPTAARDDGTKKPAASSWLLDAMALQDKPKPGARSGTDRLRGEERPLLDASDPAFMLKLYLAQEPAPAAPAGNLREREATRGPTGDVGSFESFLSRWMSPRDVRLLGLGEAGTPAPAGAPGPTLLVPFAPPPPTPPAERPANPYLEAMKADLASPPPAVIIDLTPASAPPSLPAASPPPSATPANAAPAVAPPPNADDGKYFPQLKRF